MSDKKKIVSVWPDYIYLDEFGGQASEGAQYIRADVADAAAQRAIENQKMPSDEWFKSFQKDMTRALAVINDCPSDPDELQRLARKYLKDINDLKGQP